MAQKLYEESNIQAIAQAIRDKNGLTTTYKTSEMAAAISAIPSGGGGDSGIPEEALHITKSSEYRFYEDGWQWFLDMYGNRITTSELWSTKCMFAGCEKLTSIPFELNFGTNYLNMASMFESSYHITHIPDMTTNSSSAFEMINMFNRCLRLPAAPYIYNAYPSSISQMFYMCQSIRDIPVDYTDTWNFSKIQSNKYMNVSGIFKYCYSLRRAPVEFLKKCLGIQTSASYLIYTGMFQECYSLDEIVNFPVHTNVAMSSNMFNSCCDFCLRLKNFTFELDPDTNAPYVVQWMGQTVDLTKVGLDYTNANTSDSYFVNTTKILQYNSGITADKHVKDDATYQALKNDPDWFTQYTAYSRYNHDSAVATINSLPDASAYGTNTLKLAGDAGSATDGGAINTLTEEEIAVAAAKGWTVTLV